MACALLRPGVAVLMLAVCFALTPSRVVRAADPMPPRQVLILHSEATFVGQIDKVEEHYRVRTDFGDTLIPIKNVAKVCDNLDDAYQYLRTRANGRDAQECLRLARWCVKQGLWEHAKTECQEALRLQPKFAEAQGLLKVVERAIEEAKAPKAEAPADKPAFAGDKNVIAISGKELSYDSQALQTFTQKIQPILSNSCATAACHGGDKGGSFTFIRISSGFTANITRDNLTKTLPHIDPQDAGNSPLLRKSLEAHGGAVKPPLAGRDAPTYQSLEEWVLRLVPGSTGPALAIEKPSAKPNPMEPPSDKPKPPSSGFGSESGSTPGATVPGVIKVEPTPPPLTPAVNPPAPINDKSKPIQLNPAEPGKPIPKPPKEAVKGGEVVADTKPIPAPKPEDKSAPTLPKPFTPSDPFDPAIFNRQMHPEKK